MSDLKFADTDNLVAFLEKPTESEGSGIQSKQKTVNGEVQLQALVDKKKVIITESTIRRDLQLEDAEGTDCLPNATIFEQLILIGAKTTAWNEFSSTMASAIICLATNQKCNFSKYIFDSMVKNVDIMDTELPQSSVPTDPIADEAANEKNVPTHSNDLLLSGKDSLKLNELMELFTNLQKKVLDLETLNTTQALEIESLKRRVKKLKKKQRSRTHKLKRLYKVGLSTKVVSSDDEASLGDQEDASKQGRKILDIDANEDITLDSTHFDTDPDIFGVHDLHGDEVFVETEEPMVNTATTTKHEKAKKQKIDDHQEEAKMKELMEVVSDEEGVAIDAIPLSTKPPSIVDYKIIKEGKINIY
ncbi:hypothetical protein Tco_1174742 [Tanacetum coccineum]